jgi:hypothetical protein
MTRVTVLDLGLRVLECLGFMFGFLGLILGFRVNGSTVDTWLTPG